jgi:hypothetical protein
MIDFYKEMRKPENQATLYGSNIGTGFELVFGVLDELIEKNRNG